MKIRTCIFPTLAIAAMLTMNGCGSASKVPAVSQEQTADGIKPTKNIILFLTDGTSTSLLSVARWYNRYITDSLDWNLHIDPYICGLMKSRLSDAIIPDSAPAMSGIVTGVPSRVRNISIYPLPHPGQDVVPTSEERAYQPAETVLEAAKRVKGKSVGLAVTVQFPHATPAACAAHNASRHRYYDLATQMASQDLDVVIGGGLKFVTRNMRKVLADNGTTLIEDNLQAMRSFNGRKMWALYDSTYVDYEIDRDPAEEPCLSEMMTKAIELLSKNENGFFLMVEGSKVDYGSHSKDPIAAVTEFLEFDRAIGKAIDFAKRDGNTTIIITADHGNCGITLGDANYRDYSSKGLDSMFVNMRNYKASSDRLSSLLRKCDKSEVKDVFRKWTGIELKDSELKTVLSSLGYTEGDYVQVSNSGNLQGVICNIMNSRTHLGYISGNHTGEDVLLAVYNPNGQRPQGIVKNSDVCDYMCKLLGLEESLETLSDRDFSKYTKVFPGFVTDIVKKEGEYPVLKVTGNGHTMEVPAYMSTVTLDGKVVKTPSPAIYMEENDTFYVNVALKDLMK